MLARRRRRSAAPAAARAYLDAHGAAHSASRAREALADQVVTDGRGARARRAFRSRTRAAKCRSPACCGGPGRPDLPYSGRLDRMLVTEDGVTIVDFKLGAAPAQPSPRACRPACAFIAQRSAAALPVAASARGARLSRRPDASPDFRNANSTPRSTHFDASSETERRLRITTYGATVKQATQSP